MFGSPGTFPLFLGHPLRHLIGKPSNSTIVNSKSDDVTSLVVGLTCSNPLCESLMNVLLGDFFFCVCVWGCIHWVLFALLAIVIYDFWGVPCPRIQSCLTKGMTSSWFVVSTIFYVHPCRA